MTMTSHVMRKKWRIKYGFGDYSKSVILYIKSTYPNVGQADDNS